MTAHTRARASSSTPIAAASTRRLTSGRWSRRTGGCQSLPRSRQGWDSAVAESFFGALKEELVHRQTFPTRAAARAATFEFIEVFCNQRRLHSSLGYLTPAEYEQQRHNQPEAA